MAVRLGQRKKWNWQSWREMAWLYRGCVMSLKDRKSSEELIDHLVYKMVYGGLAMLREWTKVVG